MSSTAILSLLFRRLEVIAIGDWERPRLITVGPKAHSLFVVLVQPLQAESLRRVSGSESRHMRRSGHEVNSGIATRRSGDRPNHYRCQETLEAMIQVHPETQTSWRMAWY